MHEDQDRGGAVRRLAICNIFEHISLTNSLMMHIEHWKFLHRKYILKKKPKCFRHEKHMRNNWELRKRGYLIRFGHTEALLLKKKDIKWPFFPPCRNWPIYVRRSKVKVYVAFNLNPRISNWFVTSITAAACVTLPNLQSFKVKWSLRLFWSRLMISDLRFHTRALGQIQ